MRVWTLRMTLWTWNQGSRPWKRGLEPEIERVATCLIHIIAFQQCVHLWSAALKDEAQEEPNFIKKCLMCTLRTATISIEPDWCISSTKNKVKYLTGFMVLLLSLSLFFFFYLNRYVLNILLLTYINSIAYFISVHRQFLFTQCGPGKTTSWTPMC